MSVIDDRSCATGPTTSPATSPAAAHEPCGTLDRALRHALDWLAAHEERPPPGREQPTPVTLAPAGRA